MSTDSLLILLAPLLMLLICAMGLLGLYLGIIIPTRLYGRQNARALVLNVAGFLLFLLPALVFFSFNVKAEEKGAPTGAELVQAGGVTLAAFLALELFIFLARKSMSR